MAEDFENPVVNCDACKKDFKNNPFARFVYDDKKLFACSGECKAKLADKMRRESKEEKKNKANEERSNNNNSRQLSVINSNVSSTQDRVTQWL
jgi:predicted sulfurtransferase